MNVVYPAVSAASLHLIVLIPHRDHVRPFHAYRRALFAAGVPGAYSFPVAAPLASVSAPAPAPTLKRLAAVLSAGTPEGAISAGETQAVWLTPPDAGAWGVAVAGPVMTRWDDVSDAIETVVSDITGASVVHRAPPVCAALVMVRPGGQTLAGELAPPPPVRFRVWQVANLTLSSLGNGLSWAWQIGRPVWGRCGGELVSALQGQQGLYANRPEPLISMQ